MLSHDECLAIVRKEYPGRAVLMSHKAENKYFFRLSYDEKIMPCNYTSHYEEICVDPENGKSEPFDVFGYRLLNLSPEKLEKFDEEFSSSVEFIDAEPKTEYEMARM